MFDSPQVKWNYFLYNRPFIPIPIRNGRQRCSRQWRGLVPTQEKKKRCKNTRVIPKNFAIPTGKHPRQSLPPTKPKKNPQHSRPPDICDTPKNAQSEEHPRMTGSMPQEHSNELLAIAIFFLKFLLKPSGLAKLCLIFFFLPNHSRKSKHWSKIPGAWKKGLEI